MPALVAAQVSGDVSLLSDYRFRGESLTEGDPALQAAVNYDHPSGIFLGGLVSNVKINPDVSGLSAIGYAGYTRPLGERSAWEAGVVTYVFPQPTYGPDYNYTEAFVGATFATVFAASTTAATRTAFALARHFSRSFDVFFVGHLPSLIISPIQH